MAFLKAVLQRCLGVGQSLRKIISEEVRYSSSKRLAKPIWFGMLRR